MDKKEFRIGNNIPITEKILLMCGFEMRCHVFIHPELEGFILSPTFCGTINFNFDSVILMAGNNKIKEISYLHELQKIFKFFTSNDLPIDINSLND